MSLPRHRQRRALLLLVPLVAGLYGLRRELIARSRAPRARAPEPDVELRVLKLASRRPSSVTLATTSPATLAKNKAFFSADALSTDPAGIGINRAFFHQLRAIAQVIVPSWSSREVLLIASHTFFLLLRTYLSLLVAQLDGRLVGDLVSSNVPAFFRGIGLWFLLAVPSILTNGMIRLLKQNLSTAFRVRLTRYIHDLYLGKGNNFYKILNLDNSIGSPDQFITADVNRFCDMLTSLYSNISKPTLDIFLFNYQLSRSIGRYGSMGLFASYLLTAWFFKRITPAFGKLSAIGAKLEGDFRNAHSRLIINSEEIAFYNGAKTEKDILNKAYLRLIRHVNSIFKIRIVYGIIEDMVVKYFWSACGYCMISIPVFFPSMPAASTAASTTKALAPPPAMNEVIAKRTEAYISNRRLLLSLADAGGRLMYSWKDISSLAGLTSRVYAILTVLHRLDDDHFISVARPEDLDKNAKFYNLGALLGVRLHNDPNDGVFLDHVPIVAPLPGLPQGSELLVKDLSLNVLPGQHILITGPNGSGKTSIARVLAGLWPVFEGIVSVPTDKDIMYLPQRPYLCTGSLRDQIIYPHAHADFVRSGRTDEDLKTILEQVYLAYLPDREGGLDTVKEWKDVLSGGEKQRMGLARLFYHRPKFGVLDECTSAVSVDVEGSMYENAKSIGITLITISHKPSLMKHHSHLLKLSGADTGDWEYKQLNEEEDHVSIQKELEDIEAQLGEVEQWKARLEQVNRELSFVPSDAEDITPEAIAAV